MKKEIPFNFPLELTDFICEKLNKKILVNLSTIGLEKNMLFILNKKRIEKYWEKCDKKELIENNDLQGIKYSIKRYFCRYPYCYEEQKRFNPYMVLACEKGRLKILKYFIENGGDVQINNDIAIFTACEHGHLDIVKLLVKNRANFRNDNCKAFLKACEKGHLDIVKYLVSLGVQVNVRNNFPLILACKYNHVEMIKYFIENGAEPADHDNEAVAWQCVNGNLEMVKYLTKNGADPTDNSLYRPFIAAACKNHIKVVKYIIFINDIKFHKNLHSEINESFIFACSKGYLEMVKYLVEIGANIKIWDNIALKRAIENNHENIVKYLESI